MDSIKDYEILYCTCPQSNHNIDDPDNRIVQYIQNAHVKVEDINLKYHFHWKNNIIGSQVEMVSILIENNNYKLGDVFFESPYGIIKKNRTGIGATTLELNSKRNSIIVVPTKALAFSKALTYFEKVGKWSVLYVGSDVDGAPNNMPEIEEYLIDETIVYKKFIVVADSLCKVIDAIGDEVKNNYFLMVDEIDSFQSDSTYRPRLESVIDYYLDFKNHNRCLVSATLNEFSNPEIAAEPIFNIFYKDIIQKPYNLIHTNNHNAVAVAEIKKLYALFPDKIVVAYNKITFILQIIEELGGEYKDNCQILCSLSSKEEAGDYYGDLNDRRLSKRITFLTSSYFVGIDIDDRFHLISISNTKYSYTLLSHDRLTQIAGRCRDAAGLYSETIIYDTHEYDFSKSPEQYKQDALDLASDLVKHVNRIDNIINKFPDTIGPGFIAVKDVIIEKATFAFSKSYTIPILRKDINDKYVPAYFIIDSIYEFYKLRTELYTNYEQLLNKLSCKDIKVNFESNMIDVSDEQDEIRQSVFAKYTSTQEAGLEKLIAELTVLYESEKLNSYYLNKIKFSNKTSRYCKVFLDRFKLLYEYLPFGQLIENLRIIIKKDGPKLLIRQDVREFRRLYNSVIFWSLDNNHSFKIHFLLDFQIGVQYTKQDIFVKLQPIISQFAFRRLTVIQCLYFFNQICSTTRGKNSKNVIIYTINSFNPKNFEGSPLNVISRTTVLNKLFLFGG